MSKHERMETVLRKLYFIKDAQRSVKEIRKQKERYKKKNLQLVSEWAHGMRKHNIDNKISELMWTVYDD